MAIKLESTNSLISDNAVLRSEDASEEEVRAEIQRLPWKNLSQILLTNDAGIQLDASGSHGSDGFAISYTKGRRAYLSKTGPTFEQVIEVACYFARDEDSWLKVVEFEYWQDVDGIIRDEDDAASRYGPTAE